MHADALCWARLPRAGLGNKLFVWAKAFIFAQQNGIPLWVSGWSRLRMGPILRGEVGRFYFGHFRRTRELGLVPWLSHLARSPRRLDPPLEKLELPLGLYTFTALPHWSDYFGEIKSHRELLRRALYDLLSPHVRKGLDSTPSPLISFHIRHGDFRELRPGEDFAKVGHVRTPVEHFARIALLIREVASCNVPIHVFSDGSDQSLGSVLSLPGVHRVPPGPPILDLLLMSQSRLIVPSAGSTFSYWSAFLSDAAILMHPEHIHAPLRPDAVNQRVYEGPAPQQPGDCSPLLRKSIEEIVASR